MGDLKEKISELAQLMAEHGLDEARLQGETWRVEFSRYGDDAPASNRAPSDPTESQPSTIGTSPATAALTDAAPTGTPISSPMMGIFYASPSPGSSPFVLEGDDVTAGQVVGLIEAMKVFNEITSPVSGKVTRILAQNNQLVQPGEPILYVG